jgi:hypothetical protein
MENLEKSYPTFWDSYAKKYDQFIQGRLASTYTKIFKKLKEDTKGTKDLLEVATGTGILFFELCNQIKKITAIDLSTEMNGKIILPTFCHGQSILSHTISRIMVLVGFRAMSRWSIESFQKFLIQNGFRIIKIQVIEDLIPMVYIIGEKET